jgi:cyanophycinase-like exopeptidase
LGFAHPQQKEFIVDQHFSQRQREERLFEAMKIAELKFGLGVDEDTAAIIENRRDLLVVGPFKVRAFDNSSGKITEISMISGERFDLVSWRNETEQLAKAQ